VKQICRAPDSSSGGTLEQGDKYERKILNKKLSSLLQVKFFISILTIIVRFSVVSVKSAICLYAEFMWEFLKMLKS